MVFHIYVLKCSDNSFYVGHSENLGKSLAIHQHGADPHCYTASRLPLELVFQQAFATRQGAIANKQLLSSWTREKLQRFIDEESMLDSDIPSVRFVMEA